MTLEEWVGQALPRVIESCGNSCPSLCFYVTGGRAGVSCGNSCPSLCFYVIGGRAGVSWISSWTTQIPSAPIPIPGALSPHACQNALQSAYDLHRQLTGDAE